MSRDNRLSTGALQTIAQFNPQSSIVAAAGMVVGGIVVGALYAYEEYQAAKEKKAKVDIELINEYHREHLDRITTIGTEIIGFPAVFEKTEDGQGWKAITWTRAQVIIAGQTALRSIEQKTSLDQYRYHLNEALNYLKKYYFYELKGNSDSTMSKVVTYLLTIVEKLMSYEGREIDIAILDGVMRFVLKCAGMSGDKSQRYTALMPVYEQLRCAKFKGLIRHQETWPIEDTISEIRIMAKCIADKMIRDLPKFIFDKSEWKTIEYPSIDLLISGVASRDGARRVVGQVMTKNSCIYLPEGTMREWIKVIASYYTQTIKDFKDIKDAPKISFFRCPDKISGNDLATIRDIFNLKKTKKYSDVERTEFILHALSEYAKLIHLIISYLRIADELLNVFKKIGEFESRDPGQCSRLYQLFDALSEEIIRQSEVVQNEFFDLAEKGGRRTVDEETFLLNTDAELQNIAKFVKEKSHYVRNRRIIFDASSVKLEVEKFRTEEAIIAEQVYQTCELSYRSSENKLSSFARTPKFKRPDVPRLSIKPLNADLLASKASTENPLPKMETTAIFPEPPKQLPKRQSTFSFASSIRVPSHRASERFSLKSMSEKSQKEENVFGPMRTSMFSNNRSVYENQTHKCISYCFSKGIAMAHSHNPYIQNLHGIRAVLLNYTGHDSRVIRFITGAWNRKYLNMVASRLITLNEKLKTINPDNAKECLEEEITFWNSKKYQLNGSTGILFQSIEYMVKKCQLDEAYTPRPTAIAK